MGVIGVIGAIEVYRGAIKGYRGSYRAYWGYKCCRG